MAASGVPDLDRMVTSCRLSRRLNMANPRVPTKYPSWTGCATEKFLESILFFGAFNAFNIGAPRPGRSRRNRRSNRAITPSSLCRRPPWTWICHGHQARPATALRPPEPGATAGGAHAQRTSWPISCRRRR